MESCLRLLESLFFYSIGSLELLSMSRSSPSLTPSEPDLLLFICQIVQVSIKYYRVFYSIQNIMQT